MNRKPQPKIAWKKIEFLIPVTRTDKDVAAAAANDDDDDDDDDDSGRKGYASKILKSRMIK
jgi:hypothetical protein